jgi:hypothetical protein
LSCEQCRKRKVKCDRKDPCTQCIESKHTPCTYSTDARSVAARRFQDQRSSQPSSSTALPYRDTTQASEDRDSFFQYFLTPGSSPSTTATLHDKQDSRGQSNNEPLEAPSVDELADREATFQRRLSGALFKGPAIQENPALPPAQRLREVSSKHQDGRLVKTRYLSSSH